jgi:hypothetical protein
MASRSLNRVLGETSLERKCRFLFGLCMTVLIAASFLWYGRRTDKMVYDANLQVGRIQVGAALNETHLTNLDPDWKQIGAGYAIVEGTLDQEYEWRTILSTRSQTTDPDKRPTNQFEWDWLDRWEREGLGVSTDDEPAPEFVQQSPAKGDEFLYYKPIFAKSLCIDCHRYTVTNTIADLKDGDLIAVMRSGSPIPIWFGPGI